MSGFTRVPPRMGEFLSPAREGRHSVHKRAVEDGSVETLLVASHHGAKRLTGFLKQTKAARSVER